MVTAWTTPDAATPIAVPGTLSQRVGSAGPEGASQRRQICEECDHYNFDGDGQPAARPCDLLPAHRNGCLWRTLLTTGQPHPSTACPWGASPAGSRVVFHFLGVIPCGG